MNPQPKQTEEKAAIPSAFERRTMWKAITAISIIVLLGSAILGIYATNYVLGFLEPVLLPVIIAAVLAYLLEPIVSWLQRRKLSRTTAVTTVMAALLLAIVAFFMGFSGDLIKQTNDLFANRERIWNQTTSLVDSTLHQPLVSQAIDSLYSKEVRELQSSGTDTADLNDALEAKTTKEKLIAYLNLNSSFLIDKGISWLTSGSKAIFGSIGIIIGLVMTPIFAFYFLKESGSISEHWHDVLPIKASHFKEEVVDTLQEINGYLISFFRGQMLVSMIDGALIGILLKVIGLDYAFTIGVAVAVLGIVPYVGTIITVIPALLIAWAGCPEWSHILLVLGIFIGVNQFDGWVIQPKIVGDSVGLHPLTVMFSVLFWTLVLGGLVGALLAVPLTASIKVLFKRYIWVTGKKENAPAERISPDTPSESPSTT